MTIGIPSQDEMVNMIDQIAKWRAMEKEVVYLRAMQQMVLTWLGYWRNEIPDRAATELQDILGIVPK